MENNKGITLMSLTIMIVLLLILSTIGINYSSESMKFATLTKLTTELEIINTQISILNQNKNYQSEYVNYGLDETEVELISQINNLLDKKLVDVYNISISNLSIYKTRFQYCSANNINKELGIDGIKGTYLINIQNKIVISFNAINYKGKNYNTLEELEKDGLAKNLYKVEYYKHENPYIPQGYYYVGGTWDTGYIIGDSQHDRYTGNEVKVLTTEMVEEYMGNLYMWIPIEEKNDKNTDGINWLSVTSDIDYTNIQSALDTYKTTYVAPAYSSQWYTTANAQYAYKNTEGRLVKYPTETPTEADTNNLLSSIYLNGGLYIKIHDAKYVEIDPNPDPEPNPQPGTLPAEYQQVEYIESTGTQYIKTNDIATSIDKVVAELSFSTIMDSFVCGNADINGSTDSYSYIFISLSPGTKGSKLQYKYNLGNTWLSGGSTPIKDKKYVIESYFSPKRQYLKIDDNIAISSEYADELIAEGKFQIFKSNTTWTSNIRLYDMAIEKDSIQIRKFIPCYSTTSVTDVNDKECPKNTIGLYDTVGGKFYTNQGTGEFLKGADV
jgi:hypothetical protein